MNAKKTLGLGQDPLDVLLPSPEARREVKPASVPVVPPTPERPRTDTAPKRAGKSPAPALQPEEPGPKVAVTLHLPLKLIERVRDAAYYVPGLTVSGMAEAALTKELEEVGSEYERTYQQTLPKRTGQLRPGRPPKG